MKVTPSPPLRVRAVVVALHGILTKGTDWPDHLDGFLTDCKVIQRDYFAGFLPVVNSLWRNRSHAEGLADELEIFGNSLPLHFVAHSNGCDIALRTIKLLADRGVRTETAIFAGSVTHPDVDVSGVRLLIRAGRLGRAFAYASLNDAPLKWSGPFKWPYRDLGRRGWMLNGKPFEHHRIQTRRFDSLGHCDYFTAANRDGVFRQMRADMGLDA